MFLSFAEAKRFLGRVTGHQPNAQLPLHLYYVAGAIAWCTGTLFECPIDVVKSQLQVQIIRAKTIPDYSPVGTTMVGIAKHIIKTNGYLGLYKGFIPHIMRNIPAGSVHLGTFEAVRIWMAKRNNIHTSQLKIYHNFIAGAIGGLLYWVLFYPLDVVKSSIQTDTIQKEGRRYAGGVSDCWRELYKEGGWKRFYRGFSPCLLRAVPANAVMLWTVAFITDSIRV